MAVHMMPDQPWQKIRALGNVLRHEYDQVSEERLFEMVKSDLPGLHSAAVEALRSAGKPAATVLAVATLSYVFLGLSFVFRLAFLGSDYSTRLYLTSEFNLALNLGLLFCLFWTRGPLAVKIPSCVACALVALTCCYVLVVNSTV